MPSMALQGLRLSLTRPWQSAIIPGQGSLRLARRTSLGLPTRPLHLSAQRGNKQVEGATDISHSQFLAHAKADSDFNPLQRPDAGSLSAANDPRYGRIDPTNSHLFKLILPLPTSLSNPRNDSPTPTAFLLHPSQPLSHLSRLIAGSLPPSDRNADITYLALTGKEADLETHLRNAEDDKGTEEGQDGGPRLAEREKSKGRWQEVSWSQSTDLSDFIKQSSSLNERFKIVIQPEIKGDSVPRDHVDPVTVQVVIPSFASRTTYLRNRLVKLSKELDTLTKQKKAIDLQAHTSARRLGTTALAAGTAYWIGVGYMTFFTAAGWDTLEPITFMVGFGSLLCGTGFLIYHNREVSYSSLLDLSITARQRSLYDKHGLDIERWTEMVAEAKTLRREIKRIAADYDIEWQGELENLQTMDRYSPPSASVPSFDSDRSGNKGDTNLDIDKTINEASELAEQTKERADKAKDAERKGEVLDGRSGEGKKQGKMDVDEKAGAKRGKQKAREAMAKAT